MEVKVNNRLVKIPDKTIENYMQKLELTEDEAIQMYLDDEGYSTNEEVEKLTKQAKENKSVQHEAKSDKPRKKVVKEVVNPEKKEIIDFLYEKLVENMLIPCINVTNPCKIIEFTYNNKQYKLDLIEKRIKKDKK